MMCNATIKHSITLYMHSHAYILTCTQSYAQELDMMPYRCKRGTNPQTESDEHDIGMTTPCKQHAIHFVQQATD